VADFAAVLARIRNKQLSQRRPPGFTFAQYARLPERTSQFCTDADLRQLLRPLYVVYFETASSSVRAWSIWS
jgi:hypothetical protein